MFLNNFKKLVKNKTFEKLLPFVFIILIAIPAIQATIRPGFFPHHDDLQAMRQLQMDKCIADFQIPCRWVPDMGYGFGFPLFNYYPPLPYYIGEIFHLIGFSFLDTVKILFILVILLSGFAMYIFAKEFFGKLGGLVSTAFYIYAPYHAVDVYVRGAMNESWAFVFYPLILWSAYKLVLTGRFNYVLLLGVFTAFLAISHLPTLMIFAPGAALWTFLWLYFPKKWSNLPKLVISVGVSLALSAFFVFPVVFEQKFAHTETLFIGYFNYLAHFLNLNQLFWQRYWGYGESVLGPADTMSFSIGHLHWIVTIFALMSAWVLRKKTQIISLAILFFFFWTYGYTFLAHQRAAPIWEIVTPLAWLQFPWRFLALTMIGTSFLAGAILILAQNLTKNFRILITGTIIAAVIILNFQFFTWRQFYPQMTDEEKFSGKLWQLQQTAGIFDYLPKQLKLPPADPPDSDAKIIAGAGTFVKVKKQSNLQIYDVKVETEKAEFQINTFYFPGWKVFANGRQFSIDPARDKINGTMIVDLQKGEHKVVAKFGETPVRLISDIISAASWLVLIVFLIFFIKTKKIYNH